jgi:DNA-binding transcriptional LysR family regulator
MGLPPMNAVRAFEVAARLKSVSRAGDELHVTHAAISHHIRHLEEWLDVKLFVKSGRSIELTDAGRSLSATLTDCFRQIETHCHSLRNSGRCRALTIACIPSIASRWLIPNLRDFTENEPDLDVRVQYARASDRLADLNADILVTLSPAGEEGVTNRKLFSRMNKPVASPYYLARRPQLTALSGMANADLLHDETTIHWLDWFRKAQVPTPALRGPVFQDFNLLATAVIAGHGIALCPVDIFRNEIARGDLIVLSDISILDDESYYLVIPARQPAGAERFADWFQGLIDRVVP